MLKLSKKIISFTHACALSTLLFFPAIAQAQVKIDPLVIEAETQRGQAKGTINITNVSNETFRARVYALPFTFKQDGFSVLQSSPEDLTPYLTFSPRELVVEPGQTRQIRVVSRLLPSMANREYRAVIFTESLQANETGKNGVNAVIPRLGVTVYVRHGNATPKLAVESASYNPQTKKIVLKVKNNGNATARPEVAWNLTNSAAKVADGKAEAYTVIATGERNIQIELPANKKEISAGKYQLTGELTWNDGKKKKTLPFNVNVTIPDRVATTENK